MLDEYRDIVGEEEVRGGRDEDSTAVGGGMWILLVLSVPICAYLKIGHMAGWKNIHKNGWRLHLLKHTHCPLIYEGSATTLPLTTLVAPVASRS